MTITRSIVSAMQGPRHLGFATPAPVPRSLVWIIRCADPPGRLLYFSRVDGGAAQRRDRGAVSPPRRRPPPDRRALRDRDYPPRWREPLVVVRRARRAGRRGDRHRRRPRPP